MPTVALAPLHNKLIRSWRLFAGSAVAIAHTGTLAEIILARVAFPAAAMGPNGIIALTSLWSTTNNANAKNPRARMGSAGFTSITGQIMGAALTTHQSYQAVVLVRNRNAQNQQVLPPVASSGTGTVSVAVATLTIDTTAAFDIVLTGQLANIADTLTLEAYMAELYYGS